MRRFGWPLVALVVAAVLVVAGVAIFGVGGSEHADDDDPFAASTGTSLDRETATAQGVAAIDALLAVPYVEVRSLAFTDGARYDLEVTIDRSATALVVRELLTTPAEPGDPQSSEPIVSERVMLGATMHARIIQPGESAVPPYQTLDIAGREAEFLEGAYTQQGRVFDSLGVIRRLIGEVPFGAERLDERRVDGSTATGIRFTFEATEVAQWLISSGLEPAATTAHPEPTVLEVWSTGGTMRRLVATGVQFQDGEGLDDVAAVIDYRMIEQPSISAPG
jgi:hypothetical protein